MSPSYGYICPLGSHGAYAGSLVQWGGGGYALVAAGTSAGGTDAEAASAHRRAGGGRGLIEGGQGRVGWAATGAVGLLSLLLLLEEGTPEGAPLLKHQGGKHDSLSFF